MKTVLLPTELFDRLEAFAVDGVVFGSRAVPGGVEIDVEEDLYERTISVGKELGGESGDHFLDGLHHLLVLEERVRAEGRKS